MRANGVARPNGRKLALLEYVPPAPASPPAFWSSRRSRLRLGQESQGFLRQTRAREGSRCGHRHGWRQLTNQCCPQLPLKTQAQEHMERSPWQQVGKRLGKCVGRCLFPQSFQGQEVRAGGPSDRGDTEMRGVEGLEGTVLDKAAAAPS